MRSVAQRLMPCLLLVLAAVPAPAQQGPPREKLRAHLEEPKGAGELVGTYGRGSLSRNVIWLAKDFTCTTQILDSLIDGPVQRGTWSLRGTVLSLKKAKGGEAGEVGEVFWEDSLEVRKCEGAWVLVSRYPLSQTVFFMEGVDRDTCFMRIDRGAVPVSLRSR